MGPECHSAHQPQQGGRERQRRDEAHDQCQPNPNTGFPELPELCEDHHPDPADHREGACGQRRPHHTQRLSQCPRDTVSFVQFLLVPSDQKQAVVHSRTVDHHSDVDLHADKHGVFPTQKPRGWNLCQQHQERERYLYRHHDSQQGDQGQQWRTIDCRQHQNHQHHRPPLGRRCTLLCRQQHVAPDGRRTTQCQIQPRGNQRLAPGSHPLRQLLAQPRFDLANHRHVGPRQEFILEWHNHEAGISRLIPEQGPHQPVFWAFDLK